MHYKYLVKTVRTGKKEFRFRFFRLFSARGGGTEKGFEFVREMNRLGMIVDCSHLSDKGFYDVINTTTKPIVCSHSSVRSVCNHPRKYYTRVD